MGIKNIVTFGYAEKAKATQKEFEQICSEWQVWETEAKAYDQIKEELKETINKIVSVCKNAGFQEKADVISKAYGEVLQSNISFLIKDVPVEQSMIVGAAAGALGAFGVFTLVGTFGVASTGAAISTLTGAAATSATWAALGGGSLAAGGAGMLGGMCVLGGIATVIAVPGALTFNSYSSMKKYEAATKELENILKKVPAAEIVKKQKEELVQLNADLKKMYYEFEQGRFSEEEFVKYVEERISTEKPFDFLKKQFDESAINNGNELSLIHI